MTLVDEFTNAVQKLLIQQQPTVDSNEVVKLRQRNGELEKELVEYEQVMEDVTNKINQTLVSPSASTMAEPVVTSVPSPEPPVPS